MKTFVFLIGLVFFLLTCQPQLRNTPLRKELDTYIERTCTRQIPCKISLSEALGFSYDKMYVFEMNVEDNVIRDVIHAPFISASPYYSRKWFFLKDGQVIRSEERFLPDVDRPMVDGDVDFDISDSDQNYSSFDDTATFEVERDKTNTGEYFRLRCINCK